MVCLSASGGDSRFSCQSAGKGLELSIFFWRVMRYYIYILISHTHSRWSYVGCTSNLKQRSKDHNSGKTKSTKGYRPLVVIYTEEYQDKITAYTREKYFKSGKGRKEKQKIVSEYSRIV